MSVTVHSHQPDPIASALLDRWRRVPVAVTVDLAPDRQVDPLIRPLLPPGRQPPLFGRAVTARCGGPDFGAVLNAISATGEGEVLVIAADGYAGCAFIGEVLGGELHRRGAAGLVCDGAVRDVEGLAGMEGFSVYHRSVNPRGPTGASQGSVNQAVTVGGCRIAPGDVLMGDGDGVVALPPRLVAELIDAAEERLALEATWRERLAEGEPVPAIFGLGEG